MAWKNVKCDAIYLRVWIGTMLEYQIQHYIIIVFSKK